MNREQLEEIRKRADWFEANKPGASGGAVNGYGWAAAAIGSAQDVPALLDEIERLNKRIDKAHDDLTRIDDGDTDEFTTFESTVEYVVKRYRALEKDFNELYEVADGQGPGGAL